MDERIIFINEDNTIGIIIPSEVSRIISPAESKVKLPELVVMPLV